MRCLMNATVVLGLSVPSYAANLAHSIEDFEDYQIVTRKGIESGSNYISETINPGTNHILRPTTWFRSGAVSEGVLVTNLSVLTIDGDQGGSVSADWRVGTRLDAVFFTNEIQLMGRPIFSVLLRGTPVMNLNETPDGVPLPTVRSVIEGLNGDIWLSNDSFSIIEGGAKVFEFPLQESAYTKVVSGDIGTTFDGSLIDNRSIGFSFRVENQEDHVTVPNYRFAIDNLALSIREDLVNVTITDNVIDIDASHKFVNEIRLGDKFFIQGHEVTGDETFTGDIFLQNNLVIAPIIADPIVLIASLRGDADLSGHVDLVDIEMILANLGARAGWLGGDVSLDRTVDLLDIEIVLANLGQTWTPGASVQNVHPTVLLPIPEPHTSAVWLFAIVVMSAFTIACRRGRR